jgi:hypothetical protein
LNGLKKLSVENKRLKLFRSDPFDYQSIVDAMKGCYGLFYMFEASQDQSTYDVSKFFNLNLIKYGLNYYSKFSSNHNFTKLTNKILMYLNLYIPSKHFIKLTDKLSISTYYYFFLSFLQF